MGRPSSYSQEIADTICAELADGRSLRSVCAPEGMPSKTTVFNWLRTFPDFLDQYARAKEEAADSLADEIVDIADEREGRAIMADGAEVAVVFDSTAVARNRLRVDSRKWIASKLKPKKYGDRQVIAGDPDAPLVSATEDQIDARINALLKAALDANPAGQEL